MAEHEPRLLLERNVVCIWFDLMILRKVFSTIDFGKRVGVMVPDEAFEPVKDKPQFKDALCNLIYLHELPFLG
ncbi:MAG: hypothetical protein JRI72_12660 [Deltaproteobacteria bacterium]|nr:hypothetical protein [Deltaproteobacteria bacterium]